MRILVAIDGSEHSIRALRYVIGLLKRIDGQAALALINVHDDAPFRNASHWLGKQSVAQYLDAESDGELAEAVALARTSGLDFEVIKRIGSITEEVNRVATEGEFEMVAVGAKGRSGLTDLLLGSVAQRIASTCPVPVLTVG